jgi:site-specific recombinase XerC
MEGPRPRVGRTTRGEHTAASLMIAANVNVKARSEFIGHSSIATTLDR